MREMNSRSAVGKAPQSPCGGGWRMGYADADMAITPTRSSCQGVQLMLIWHRAGVYLWGQAALADPSLAGFAAGLSLRVSQHRLLVTRLLHSREVTDDGRMTMQGSRSLRALALAGAWTACGRWR